MSSRALLRVKRRRSDDPCEALLISCRPKRPRDADQAPSSAGGDYEGAEWSDAGPPRPVVSKVFHLAGTVAAAADQERLVTEIKQTGKPARRPKVGAAKGRRAGKKAEDENKNLKAGEGVDGGVEPYKAVLRNRHTSILDDNDADLRVFDVVKTDDATMVDELDEEFRLPGREVITCNDIALEEVGHSTTEYVYDLYYSTAQGPEAKLDLSFLETYLDVKPYRNEDLDALENYGVVEPASMLERGFLGVEDEDSNEEDNWRNDYPDSDPEENFDREEPDYDQCGFIHDPDQGADVDDGLLRPLTTDREERLAHILSSRMRLGDAVEDEDAWDDGDPSESRAYANYKKRTIAQLKKMGQCDDSDEAEEDDDDDDDEDYDSRYGVLKVDEEQYRNIAYDDLLDKDSESDSFDNYDD